MDVRLTSEQRQLRDAAARLADDLGPDSVAELSNVDRTARLEKAIDATGWRTLRADGGSGVEVAIVAEELGRGLVDVPFLGPVLADDLARHLPADPKSATSTVAEQVRDTRGYERALALRGHQVVAGAVGERLDGADLTRHDAEFLGPFEPLGELAKEHTERWHALALVITCADLVGTSRGAHTLGCEYAKVREQYGNTIGSYQAVAHLLAEGLALIEGAVSVLRHAAWSVDELTPDEALRAARIAKVYCADAARTVCETAVQVHGGIGNTWECLAHVYLRRVLASVDLFPVRLEELHHGLS